MPATPPHPGKLQALVAAALEEDLGRGDLTTEACIDMSRRGHAELRARESLVVAGMPLVGEVFRQLDAQVTVAVSHGEGEAVASGDLLATLHGPASTLLRGERVALNFLQRLSGIASLTRRYVDALPAGSGTRIADTRKTTPGWRALERYAVRCGGGHNHRQDLGAAPMIKDNHIAACGSIAAAVARVRAHAPHTARIACEVDALDQIDEALTAGADILMLDNFDDAMVRQAVRAIGGRALVEVTGGVDLTRIPQLAQAGVDVISVGALTHSARAVDIGMDWRVA